MWNTDPEDMKKLEEKRIRKLQEESLRLQKEQREKDENETKMREVMMPAYAPKKDDGQNLNELDSVSTDINNHKVLNEQTMDRERLCDVSSSNGSSDSSKSTGFQFNPEDY